MVLNEPKIEPIEWRTTKWWVTSVIRILKGETSVAEVTRHQGLTVAEIEDWREKFLLGAENSLQTRSKDGTELQGEQAKKLKQNFWQAHAAVRETNGP